VHWLSYMPKPVTRPDLICRYEALEYSSQSKFEAKHGLPANLIGKMRLGQYNTAASEHTLLRFEEAIAREERGEPPAPIPEKPAKGPGRPRLSATLDPEDQEEFNELVKCLEEASDISLVDEANRKVEVALVKGIIAENTARVLKELLGERRQALKEQREQEERAKTGNELVIKIHYVNDWVGGPLPEQFKA